MISIIISIISIIIIIATLFPDCELLASDRFPVGYNCRRALSSNWLSATA